MKTLSVGAAVVVALLALGGRAADIAVGDGESFALDGANNVAANRLVFPAGAATLTLTGAVAGENELNVQVIAADAAASVTLTVADGVGKTLRFANHVSVKGSLSVSGFDAVKAGNTAVTPATVDVATDLVAPFPAFDVATLATSVTIDGAVQLPQFATTYTGTVTLSQSTLDIALDGEGQTASGGFSIPGTVSLPSSVTVNLTCPAHLHVNTSVKLASWGALGSQTAFTLGTVSGVRRGGLILALRAAQDGLYFDVKGTGTSLFFR